jgi:hypothetical protein
VTVRATLLEEHAVLPGEVLTEWSPRLIRAKVPVQEKQRIAFTLDFVPGPDAGQFDVRAPEFLPFDNRTW